MLVLRKPQISLWDGILPEELRQMPPDLAAVDEYLDDDRFMEPFLKRGQQKVGRPTVPMERYLRLMYLKHSRGLGYETLVAEVNDSITLRRFCRFDVADRLPHPTTLSRLSQRFGDQLIRELHEELVSKLHEENLISGRRARTDTTVVAEVTVGDYRYPQVDLALCSSWSMARSAVLRSWWRALSTKGIFSRGSRSSVCV